MAGIPEKITDITVALDKYEKIGWENVIGRADRQGNKK